MENVLHRSQTSTTKSADLQSVCLNFLLFEIKDFFFRAPLRVTSHENPRSHFPLSFIVRISRMRFKLDAEGGWGWGPPLILSLVSIGKTSTFSVAHLFFEMAPESHPLGKTSTSSAWARHEWAPHFSIDKNSTLSSTDCQTLRTQWFGDTLATPRDKSNTFRASRLSGTTNTVLSNEASSKMLDIDFARQNKYFQRSTNSLSFFCSTKQVLQASLYSQTWGRR